MPFNAGQIYAVDGSTITGQLYRLNLQASTREQHGVLGSNDLQATQQVTPDDTVLISSGAFYAVGMEETFQGTYFDVNVGDATSPPFSGNSGGTDRFDLLYVRVEDPSLTAVTWAHDPETDPISYFVIQENVAEITEDIPAGETGEPIAIVKIPAGVLNPQIGAADIVHDRRRLADPKFFIDDQSNPHPNPLESSSSATYVDCKSFSRYKRWGF